MLVCGGISNFRRSDGLTHRTCVVSLLVRISRPGQHESRCGTAGAPPRRRATSRAEGRLDSRHVDDFGFEAGVFPRFTHRGVTDGLAHAVPAAGLRPTTASRPLDHRSRQGAHSARPLAFTGPAVRAARAGVGTY